MKIKLLLLTFVFFASACIAKANTTPPGNGDESKKADVAGGVISAETRKPLSNVSVSVYTANKKEKMVYTDVNGNYSFNDLKPGTYKLIFEKDGFRKVTKEKVMIRSDEGCHVNIEMEEHDNFQLLPGILLSDFE